MSSARGKKIRPAESLPNLVDNNDPMAAYIAGIQGSNNINERTADNVSDIKRYHHAASQEYEPSENYTNANPYAVNDLSPPKHVRRGGPASYNYEPEPPSDSDADREAQYGNDASNGLSHKKMQIE